MNYTTVFDTPLLNTIMHHISKWLLSIFNWRTQGSLPDLPKFVLIAAPHTSNWDFIVMLLIAFAFNARLFWMGKAEMFRWPFAAFFKWLGGIPVDRSKSSGVVEQMTEAFQASNRMILTIAPEGTRGKVRTWKTGFYAIAKSAGIPIVLGFLDFGRKIGGFGPTFTPTSDMAADLRNIQAFYVGMQGCNPHLTSEIGPSDEGQVDDQEPRNAA